jgi:hypothetical protein
VQQPATNDVPPPDTLMHLADGGITVTTSRDAGHPAHLAWDWSPPGLPPGATVSKVDTRVCGHGDGDFYEVYGPFDADPVEYEVTAPASDGCWHFSGGPSDYSVTIYAYGNASMTIDKIEMTLTSDR